MPNILFLYETHLDRESGDRLRLKLGFAHMRWYPSNGRAGGLMLLWKELVKIQLKYQHTNYIDVLVSSESPEKDWRLTEIYGESIWCHKHRTWCYLWELHQRANKSNE
jgi:hypothetical protein